MLRSLGPDGSIMSLRDCTVRPTGDPGTADQRKRRCASSGSVGPDAASGRDARVRLTGTGHASLRIDTAAGSILCDPWVNPAYFASWFPFPDNRDLDWDALGDCDYLYVSHLHADHFDAKNLSAHVNKDAMVLLPDFPVPDLRRELE